MNIPASVPQRLLTHSQIKLAFGESDILVAL
jgi:hypothetical protein